jgi:hypothetical protein
MWSPMPPHDEFLELCAVFTSDSLSGSEKARLEAHLAGCTDCRRALRAFQTAAQFAVSLFAAEASHEPSPQSEPWSLAHAEKRFCDRITVESNGRENKPYRNGVVRYHDLADEPSAPVSGHWNVAWLSLAATVLLVPALGVVAYRTGLSDSVGSTRITLANGPTQISQLQEEASDGGHDREVLLAQMAQRDKAMAELRRQLEQKTQELNSIKDIRAKLEQAVSGSGTEKRQLTETAVQLSNELVASEASLRKAQGELETLRGEGEKDGSQAWALQAKIDDLNHLLQEREVTIDRQQEFLAKDRDVRELMGARDLYIAEVFDVAKTGATQKPYGRIFYTKATSLVFFAYDLDKQAGAREASSFQAWGRRGSDKSQSLNLGIFYEDNASKRRWKLQFDDPKKLDEIDAVFVTVEPAGGSRLPRGKRLLFAYLKIDPNHP